MTMPCGRIRHWGSGLQRRRCSSGRPRQLWGALAGPHAEAGADQCAPLAFKPDPSLGAGQRNGRIGGVLRLDCPRVAGVKHGPVQPISRPFSNFATGLLVKVHCLLIAIRIHGSTPDSLVGSIRRRYANLTIGLAPWGSTTP